VHGYTRGVTTMRSAIVALTLLTGFSWQRAVAQSKADPTEEEFARLRGTWRVVPEACRMSKERHKFHSEYSYWVLGYEARLLPPGGGFIRILGGPQGRMQLHLDRKPKQVDFTYDTLGGGEFLQTWRAIYDLQGDTWRLCWNEKGDERPTAFPDKEAP